MSDVSITRKVRLPFRYTLFCLLKKEESHNCWRCNKRRTRQCQPGAEGTSRHFINDLGFTVLLPVGIESINKFKMDSANESSEKPKNMDEDKSETDEFKKPVLAGKLGRLPKKLPHKSDVTNSENVITSTEIEHCDNVVETVELPKTEKQKESSTDVPYQEPQWSGLPKSNGKDYSFEVLKNGSILEAITLMDKSFWVFGRSPACDICMQHPTISRFHAVLQYREFGDNKNPAGFYIYDLGSTHGTFLNKNRIKPKIYVRIQVGHMIKLGCSTRSYILNGPEYDEEAESELTVTELKQKRAEEIRQAEEDRLRAEKEMEERKRKEEERGVDWGLGEDADEETDLSENPYAQTTNEELYLDDPKKALRGFFEREGHDLEYNCSERGMGQFVCKVELPLDDEMGKPLVAEVIHKGKKKEAVVQCALEACRMLDRAGVLRQATHESRKRKAKNWEENDFYDSDDDTFLDRTGTIEKKREKRMNAKLPQKAETYESLVEKEKSISSSITEMEKRLLDIQSKINTDASENPEEDSLDSYMKELRDEKPDKHTVSKLKFELSQLKQEHANVIKLANIAKPASLPPLVPQYSNIPTTSKNVNSKAFPAFGKRKKIKLHLPSKPLNDIVYESNDMDDEEEEEKEAEKRNNNTDTNNQPIEKTDTHVQEEVCDTTETSSQEEEPKIDQENIDSSSLPSSSSSGDEQSNSTDCSTINSLHNTLTFKKFEKLLKNGLPPFADKHQEKLEKILSTLKKLAASEDRMHVNFKILAAKKRKVMKLISDLKNCETDDKLEHQISAEFNRILQELNTMSEEKSKAIGKVRKMGSDIRTISQEINKEFKEYQKEMEARQAEKEKDNVIIDIDQGDNDDDRKKEKNERRNQRRQEKAENERRRGYEEDATREDYSMWLPPKNQRGDGRTDLNDKYGY